MYEDGSGISRSPLIKRAAAQILSDSKFVEELTGGEISLCEQAPEILAQKFERLGRATLYIADTALREFPPQEVSLGRKVMKLWRTHHVEWPLDMFAATINMEGTPSQQRLGRKILELWQDNAFEALPMEPHVDVRVAAAAKVFAQAREARLRESVIPYLGSIKFDKICKINTGYGVLQRRVMPPLLRKRFLKQAYEEGFDRAAHELGLTDLSLEDGKEIIRRAPRRILGVPISITQGEDLNEAKVQVLTEHGAILHLTASETAQARAEAEGDNITYDLPISAQQLWQRSRAKDIRPPDANEVRVAFEKVWTRLKDKVDEKSYF